MVNTQGAVLLDAAIEVEQVGAIGVADTFSERKRYPPTYRFGARHALECLFAASTLQALAIHTRRERGTRFNADMRDVYATTMGQLAALIRVHDGTTGQAFELAVADAINAGAPGVTDPVCDALQRIGIAITQPRAVVVGLEKAVDPDSLASAVAEALGDRTLHVGKPGRRPKAANAVRQLLSEGTSITGTRGELALADLLVFDEDEDLPAVTTSVKIKPQWHVNIEHPPKLWIVGHPNMPTITRRPLLPDSCTTAIVGGPELVVLEAVVSTVQGTLDSIDLGRRPRWVQRAAGPTPAERVLWERRRGTVGQAVDELHERAADLARVYGLDLAAEAGVSEGTLHTLALITPDNPDGMEKHTTEDGQVLYVPKGLGAVQPHRQFLSRRAA